MKTVYNIDYSLSPYLMIAMKKVYSILYTNHIGKTKQIKGRVLRDQLTTFNINVKSSEIRKIINYLRCSESLFVCSDTKGYWIATNKKEIIVQIESLRLRSAKILAAANGMEKNLINKTKSKI